MLKKIISFFVLFFLFFSTFSFVFASEDYDAKVYPYNYRNFYPQDNATITLKGESTPKSFIDQWIDGTNSQLFNVLAFHSKAVTPGYAPQIYTILPQDLDWYFGDITLHIRNLEYKKRRKDKIRPVVTIEYRDENNSPIYTSYWSGSFRFDPMEHMIYGMGPWNFESTPVEGKWYWSDKHYKMDIKLPMKELSKRPNYFDEQLISWPSQNEKKPLAKLKYIKVKISLASISNGSTSYLSCTQFRNSNLEDSNSRAANFGWIFKNEEVNTGYNTFKTVILRQPSKDRAKTYLEDNWNLYFFNWLKYRIISLITLGYINSNWDYTWPNTFYRSFFQKRIMERNRMINKLEQGLYYNEFPNDDNSSWNRLKSLKANANPYLFYGNEDETRHPERKKWAQNIYDYKKSFLLEDCVALRIKPQPLGKDREDWKYFRTKERNERKIPEDLNLVTGWYLDDVDWIDCPSFWTGWENKLKNTLYGCNDWKVDDDLFSYKAYAPWLGFWFIPFAWSDWVDIDTEFPGTSGSNHSTFKYNIWISSTKPDINIVVWSDEEKQDFEEKLKNVTPPKLIGSFPFYDWKHFKPIISRTSFSTDLNDSEKKYIKKWAKRYCNYISVKEWIDKTDCENTHWLHWKEKIKASHLQKNRYIDTLNIYSPLYYDNYWKASWGKSWFPRPVNSYVGNYNEFEKAMGLLDTDGNNTGTYIYMDKFVSTIPGTLLELYKREENSDITPDIDSSFQRQTFFPKEILYWGKTLDKLEYNSSLQKGQKKLYFWTYDLDSSLNGGKPALWTNIEFKVIRVNANESPNSPNYIDIWPTVIKINGKYTKGKMDDKVEMLGSILKNRWKDYKSSTGYWESGSYNSGSHLFRFPWPEWNNQTSLFKINIKKLYEELKKDLYWTSWPWSKYLKDWNLDDVGALKNNLYFRVVVNKPNQTPRGWGEDNIIYTLSNTSVWISNMTVPDWVKTSYDLKLIDVTKKLNTVVIWEKHKNVRFGTWILESRSSSTVLDKNKVWFGFRLSIDNLFNNDIINPYLLRNNFIWDNFNLENIDFSSSELNNFVYKTRKLEDNETVINDNTIKVNGINYKKECIKPTTDVFKSILDRKGNANLQVIPKQYVCYYVKEGVISKSDLENNEDFRKLIYGDENYLPYVDIYINYKVKKNSDLKEVEKSSYVYNILNSPYPSLSVYDNNDFDDDGNTTEKIDRPMPATFNDLVNSGSLNSSLVQTNKSRLLWEPVLSRFSLTDYSTNTENKNKRINLPLYVYFDKLEEDWNNYTYNQVEEVNKLNNVTINLKGYIDANKIDNGGLTLTFDYPKIDSENDWTSMPTPDNPKPIPTTEKEIGDLVKVYPKIINSGWKDICDLKISYDIISWISDASSTDPNSQNLNSNDVPFVNSWAVLFASGASNPTWDTVWINGTHTKDLVNLKDYKYIYKLDNINNQYSYKVKYKYCWEESDPYREEVSPTISFKVKGLPASWAWICHLNDTLPVTGSDVGRWNNIKYRIVCTNITASDIYDLQVKMPLPNDVRPVDWLWDEWRGLGSLAPGESISYITNPLDMIKNVKVAEDSYVNDIIIWHLDYRYKDKETNPNYIIDFDEVNHRVINSSNDMLTVKTLRGPCNGRNEYKDQTPKIYPYIPRPWTCVSKLNATDKNWNIIDSNDNKACLVVKYFRLGKDTKINTNPKQNNDPDLYRGRTTNNNDLSSKCSRKNQRGGWEGSMRWKYVNVRTNIDIEIPQWFTLNWSTNAYTDYNASINNLSKTNIGSNKYRYRVVMNSSWESENSVKNNNFQRVLKDWKSDTRNRNKLTAAFVELRIPLKAIKKGSWEDWSITNYKGEVVTDNMKIKATRWQITYDKKRWEKFDSRSYCYCSKQSCYHWRCYCTGWGVAADNTAYERYNWTTKNETFPLAVPDEEPVCISSPWAWIQVLNGWMYVKDLSNLKDIEHKVDPNNPASYNTNWFYNQGSTWVKPSWFLGADNWANDIFNFDNKFVTKKCYKFDEKTQTYDFAHPYEPTYDNHKCEDWTKPWFYAIIDWDYWYLYEFTQNQLRNMLTRVIDLDTWDDWITIRDRIWLYEERKYSKPLVIWKSGVKEVKIKWKGSIFVTKNITDLNDKSATLNINSNIVYENNEIKVGTKQWDYKWDSMAVVVNWNLRIWSKVEKMEGMYFVDWDVYIEEGKNTLEIDKLYVTWNLYIKRTSTTNSQIDRFTGTQDRPVFRVTWWKERYFLVMPKIMKTIWGYYKEIEVPANDLNLDCIKLWKCR